MAMLNINPEKLQEGVDGIIRAATKTNEVMGPYGSSLKTMAEADSTEITQSALRFGKAYEVTFNDLKTCLNEVSENIRNVSDAANDILKNMGSALGDVKSQETDAKAKKLSRRAGCPSLPV